MAAKVLLSRDNRITKIKSSDVAKFEILLFGLFTASVISVIVTVLTVPIFDKKNKVYFEISQFLSNAFFQK